jgi:hypothetical protein
VESDVVARVAVHSLPSVWSRLISFAAVALCMSALPVCTAFPQGATGGGRESGAAMRARTRVARLSAVQLDNVAVGNDVAGSDLLTIEPGRPPHACVLE